MKLNLCHYFNKLPTLNKTENINKLLIASALISSAVCLILFLFSTLVLNSSCSILSRTALICLTTSSIIIAAASCICLLLLNKQLVSDKIKPLLKQSTYKLKAQSNKLHISNMLSLINKKSISAEQNLHLIEFDFLLFCLTSELSTLKINSFHLKQSLPTISKIIKKDLPQALENLTKALNKEFELYEVYFEEDINTENDLNPTNYKAKICEFQQIINTLNSELKKILQIHPSTETSNTITCKQALQGIDFLNKIFENNNKPKIYKDLAINLRIIKTYILMYNDTPANDENKHVLYLKMLPILTDLDSYLNKNTQHNEYIIKILQITIKNIKTIIKNN